MRVKCNSCGGTYAPLQPDGSEYYHACAPLSAPEIDAAVKAGKLQLPTGMTPDQAATLLTIERPNRRDENVISTRASDSGTMKANGAGTTAAPDPAPIVVSTK